MTILLQPLLGNNRYAILVICVLGLLVLQSCTTSPDSICVETQTDITTLHSPTSYPSPLSGDGQHIVLPSRGGIYLYNTTTWQEESYLLSEPCEGYANVDFSSDNTIIAAKLAPQNTRRTDASRIFFLWDVETGALLHDWVDREKNWKYAGGGIYLSPDAARVAVPFSWVRSRYLTVIPVS